MLPVLEHDDPSGLADGGEAVGDHDRGASGEQAAQALLDARLGVQVHVGGGLVEDEDARVGDQGAREGDQLALAGGELRAALADLGVVAVGELGDELVGADRGRGGADLTRRWRRDGRRRCSRAIVPENRNASCGHDPHLRAQRGARDVAQVVPVHEHPSVGGVVEARHELRHRGLARACRADERDRLPGRDLQVDVIECEHLLVRAAAAPCSDAAVAFDGPALVGEGDVLEADLAANASQLVRVRPVLQVGTHVEQLEDLLQRRHPRLVGRVQLGELLDRVEQVRERGDERDDRARR